MKVNSVVSGQGWTAAAGTGHLQGRSTHDQATGPAASSARPAAPSSAPSTYDGQSGPQQGVVRLLQEGHFRGVADVRLRINHAEALAAVGETPMNMSAQDRLQKMLESISSIFEHQATAADLAPERQAAAVQALESFGGAVSRAGGVPSVDPLVLAAELRNAFEGLMQALQTLFGEAGAAETDPSASQASLEAMEAVFQATLESLETPAATGDTLPAVSEPKGKGGAYDKFLAAYTELQAGTASEPASALRLAI